MADKDKKKGLFGKAVDAITNRDEKEEAQKLEAELTEAKKEAEAARKAIKSVMDKSVEEKKDKISAEKEVQEAEKKIEELENKLNSMMIKDRERLAEERNQMMEERQARMEASKGPEIITKHTVDSENPTLSHIALKYYNHATPPYWKYLLEHNTEVLKGSEKNVRVGMVLDIPELPEELKD